MSKLTLKYSKREKDIICHYPEKRDASLLFGVICNDILRFDFDQWIKNQRPSKDFRLPYNVENFKEELIKRGYDITTIKFSISKLPPKE